MTVLSRSTFRLTALLLLLVAFFILFSRSPLNAALQEKPNIVIVMTDDQGYADLGCYGAEGFQTPHIDRLAKEGRRFTSFYAGATVCSPTRAAMLTGCYPVRVGITDFVFFPTRGENPGPGPQGLHPNEFTIAEMLKDVGYTTACVGKWHLGDAKPFLPTRQGFDEYFGLPYANDMINRPNAAKQIYPPFALYDGETAIETDPDQRFLTRRYTERAVEFIKKNQKTPFFLFLAHTMPHVPLHVHPEFEGKSQQGIYGDIMQEIDWSVGEVTKTLKECGLGEKTWVIFTSDNGPWLTKGSHGGSAKPLREGKQTEYEGGHRVPCVMWYPGMIKAGTTADGIVSTIDFLPSMAAICGGTVPTDRKIDGVNAWSYFTGEAEQSPRDTYFYTRTIVRQGRWKLFLPGRYLEQAPEKTINKPVEYQTPRLYDLDSDIGESNDVSSQHPKAVARLEKLLADFNLDLNENSRPLGDVNPANPKNTNP